MSFETLDQVSLGIVAGILACAIPGVIRVMRHGKFETGKSVLEFFAGFAIPAGVALISAGIVGKVESLPTHWREHIAVAGVVVFGLSLIHIINSCKGALARTSRGESD